MLPPTADGAGLLQRVEHILLSGPSERVSLIVCRRVQIAQRGAQSGKSVSSFSTCSAARLEVVKEETIIAGIRAAGQRAE